MNGRVELGLVHLIIAHAVVVEELVQALLVEG